jgi:hypothetical protein
MLAKAEVLIPERSLTKIIPVPSDVIITLLISDACKNEFLNLHFANWLFNEDVFIDTA